MAGTGVKIIGTGGYLPGDPILNSTLIETHGLDTTDEWIQSHLGIRARHWAPDELATSHLAARAAAEALASANITADSLERIILCTSTGNWISPASACHVQSLLGANCPAEDKVNACAGFLYGLDHGARLVATGLQNVLVIGADVKSRFISKSDRRFLPIFADGAGAVILASHNSDEGLLSCKLWADGSKSKNLYTPAGGSALPANTETLNSELHYLKYTVEGREIFNDAVEIMTRLANEVCEEQGIQTSDIDLLIPHQANVRIIEAVGKNLAIPLARTVLTIGFAANIVAGTIPFSLDYAYKKNLIKPGMLVLMVAVGAGYAGGAALYRVPEE